MGTVGVFDGEKIQLVSSGALAMAMHLRNTIDFEDSKPLRNNSLFIKFSEIVQANKDLKAEIEDLRSEIEAKDQFTKLKVKQWRSAEKELDKYDRVFKKYDLMFGVIVSTINSYLHSYVLEALKRRMIAIWRE